ncbi:transporter substrate-binding domain-containing protein [Alkalihalobacillus sp. MEB130]|uniref:transporter substrate-binding domain-containing protein n=1 Tax=Alkalihalobacillus sp. MEB130 TaxID=2976704 RepID=UPI0028DD42C5|nr:transporter substrate-binding domain-containing protein [Alkalihalobacillus sp. MEB130]MDT8861696.1 transporter substrate-binding domain-containing protein [Alkalihalobacillus sp. MEB130]
MKKSLWMVGVSAILSVGILAGCGGDDADQLVSFEIPSEGELGSAIAFPKGSELVEPFNESLNGLVDSGKLDELVLKWFDADEAGTDEAADETEPVDAETTLIMGTSADYPPYESVDLATGEIIGFDIDIARHITQELGYELQIEDMDFNALIPAMESGRVDFVLAGMTPTEERQENVDFSDIYYEATNLIVSKESSNLTSLEDLEGLKVGVQLGSIQEEEADELAEEYGFEVVKLNRIPEIMQELMAGRIDAILMEDTVAEGHLAQ